MDSKKRGQMIREVILRVIIEYTEKHGYAPTYAEICTMSGLRSKNTVWNHIKRMIADGMLETDAYNDRSARAIRVPGYKLVKQGEPKTNADRIRSMTDEELAEWLHNIAHYENSEQEPMVSIYDLDRKVDIEMYDSYGDLLKWLQKEVDQNHGK